MKTILVAALAFWSLAANARSKAVASVELTGDAKIKALLAGAWTDRCDGRTFIFQPDGNWLIGEVTEKWDVKGGELIEVRPAPETALAFTILFLTKHEFLAQEASHGQGYFFLTRSNVDGS